MVIMVQNCTAKKKKSHVPSSCEANTAAPHCHICFGMHVTWMSWVCSFFPLRLHVHAQSFAATTSRLCKGEERNARKRRSTTGHFPD